jgi:hypothetical protein
MAQNLAGFEILRFIREFRILVGAARIAKVCFFLIIAAFRAQGRFSELSATSGLMHRSKKGLLDHLVGATGGSWVSRTPGWEGPNVIFRSEPHQGEPHQRKESVRGNHQTVLRGLRAAMRVQDLRVHSRLEQRLRRLREGG